jgi:hypothetical protein
VAQSHKLGPVPRLLSSYRWRRRLLWIGVVLALIGGAVGIVVSLPERSGPPPESPLRDEPAQVVREQKHVRITRADRRAVDALLVEFVRTAVARRDPELAWPLATRAMRVGTTRSQWRRGELPVFPYPAIPAQAKSWTVVSSYADDLTVDLVLQPPRGSKRGPVEFNAELKRVGQGSKRRWLVDSFLVIRTYPSAAESGKKAAPKALPPNYKPKYPKGRLSPLWFVVPGVILGLIVLIPLGIAVVNWRRGVRAERAYRRAG